MTQKIVRIIALLVLLMSAFSTLPVIRSAFAAGMSVSQAKAQGLVGEQVDGYLGIVGAASPDVQAIVASTNAGRLKVYQETAARQKVPLSTVQALAGKNLIEKSPAGHYVQMNGKWVKK
ncbi:MAG: YdbL family protein [Pseudobdellovibrionaceae bacterium]